MASPLTSEMNIETIQDNGPSGSICLKHTVAQSNVALLTAGRSQKERVVDREKLELYYSQHQEYIQYDTGMGGSRAGR